MSSVKKNYIYNVIYEILIIVIPLITSPYISRVLGAKQVGIYTYWYTQVSYFVLFAKLGIVNHGSRSIAAAKTEEEKSVVFSNTYLIQLILSLMMCLLYFCYLIFIKPDNYIIGLIMFAYLLASIFDVNWFFFGIEKFKITVTRNITIKIISTILLFAIVKNSSDLWKYALILGVSQLFGQIAVWPYLRRYVKFTKPNLTEMKAQFIPLVILFIPQIAVSLYKMMDKIMVGGMCSKEQLGYYEYASLIVSLPLGFITSLGTVMLPRITSMLKDGNKDKSQEYTYYSILFAIGLSSAFCFGLSSIAPTLIPFYFGTEFIPASTLLVGLSSTLLFLSWANVIRTQYLIPVKKDKEYIISLFSGAGINIILNAILIPRFQAWGAVIGTIAAEVTVCILQTYMSRSYIPIKKYLLHSIGFIVAGICMYIIVNITAQIKTNVIISLILQVVIGASAYVLLTWVYLKYILKMDLRVLLIKVHNR